MAKSVGKALKEARLARGLSQRDLESATGMSASQISQIESGTRKDPAFSTVLKLATAIGISLDAIAGAPFPRAKAKFGSRALSELERARADAEKLVERLEKLIEPGR